MSGGSNNTWRLPPTDQLRGRENVTQWFLLITVLLGGMTVFMLARNMDGGDSTGRQDHAGAGVADAAVRKALSEQNQRGRQQQHGNRRGRSHPRHAHHARQQGGVRKPIGDGKCWNCGKFGHVAHDCPQQRMGGGGGGGGGSSSGRGLGPGPLWNGKASHPNTAYTHQLNSHVHEAPRGGTTSHTHVPHANLTSDLPLNPMLPPTVILNAPNLLCATTRGFEDVPTDGYLIDSAATTHLHVPGEYRLTI